MRHITRIKTWIIDEEGNQPEFDMNVTVDVYDVEDGDVQFRSIDEAHVSDPDPDSPWPVSATIPVDQMPADSVETVKFYIDEHKYEIANEAEYENR